MAKAVRYPLGDQSFERIRREGFLYVDKTRYIQNIVDGSKYYFLARPRRFGKSLFLSTLKCFYEGKRELFSGLYADTMDWNWEPYPVILLDLNTKRYKTKEALQDLLLYFFEVHEEKFGISAPEYEMGYSTRFARLIRETAKMTGKSVVILVDEYDKALVNNIHNRELFDYYRSTMAEVYSNFKSAADYIKLVFMTGVSRFAKLSVFSDLNNMADISFASDFAGICGISEAELLENFKEGIVMLSEEFMLTEDETVAVLKRRYDGYHFSPKSPDIYNPYSLLSVFAKKELSNHWIDSGTPSILLQQLKRTNADLTKVMMAKATRSQLAGLDIDNINPVALFYQTGYLTIKSYNPLDEIYTLGVPNDEVRQGFMEFILPSYANLHDEESRIFVSELRMEMEEGRVDEFMMRIKSLFADTSYEMRMDEERNVQNALFILFRLVGLRSDVEYRTSSGRIDILVRTSDYVYIMELKYDKSAEEALEQIVRKEYSLPWSVDNRRVIAIGINFSTTHRTIANWIAREM